jgi:hypothetical protein
MIMNDEKIWVGGAFFKRKNFANGGAITNMWSPNVDELCQWLQANKKADGTIAINISGSKEPRMDDHGNEKLNASLDTWAPEGQGQQAPAQAPQQPMGVDPSFAAPQTPVGPQFAQPQAPQPQAPQAPAPQFDPQTGQRLN